MGIQWDSMGIDFKEMQHLEIHHWLVVFRPWKIYEFVRGHHPFSDGLFRMAIKAPSQTGFINGINGSGRSSTINSQMLQTLLLDHARPEKTPPVLNLTKNQEATDSINVSLVHLGFIRWKLALDATIFPTSSSQFFSHFARTRKSIPMNLSGFCRCSSLCLDGNFGGYL